MAIRRLPEGTGERLIDDAQIPTTMRQLLDRAPAAFANNQAFLALNSPTNAQTLAQVQALTRQVNALFKLTVDPSDTAGT